MAEFPCLLRNISGRPLELHGAGTVRVLVPGATLLVESKDAELDALERKGWLSRHAAPPAAPPAAPSAALALKAKPQPQPKAKARLPRTSAAQRGDKA